MSTVNRALRAKEPTRTFADLDITAKKFLAKSTVTLFAFSLLSVFLLPLVFMTVTSLKSEEQIGQQTILPLSPVTAIITEGPFASGQYEIYSVPLPDGSTQSLALVRPGREDSTFVDPMNPTQPIEWVGRWRTLEPTLSLDPQFSNFGAAWNGLDFLLVLRNTGVIAGVGMAATVISSTFVAYGLSRFRMPAKKLVVASLLATMILPPFVTLVPTYAAWLNLGLIGTWWPLLIPHFFGNAYNIFLLRQFFLGIPRDFDEAAALDGASPVKTLLLVILPQAKGAILAVSLFHFFFAWNDFFNPLIYLSSSRDLQPITVALYEFLGVFGTDIPLIQAGALLSMAIPIVVFLLLQKVFLSGIDLSGSIRGSGTRPLT